MLPEDIAALKAIGVVELFVPDTPLEDIVRFFKEHGSRHHETQAAVDGEQTSKKVIA